jgi:NAD(P)-dependent dehydrogenase (short-subunit alcohol dehydrogenase family)
VAVAARGLDEVERVAAELRDRGGRASAFRCDVARPDDVQALVLGASEALGPVDILVNNAGVGSSAPLERVTLEEWSRVWAVNATGTFLCTRALLPAMLARGWGRVVNVASVAGLEGAKYVAAYTASKHAVVGFTRAVAAEVAGRGVTVNALCPGYVDTPLTRATLAGIRERSGAGEREALERLLAHAGQARLIEAGEVAEAVVALCRDAAADTNGEAIRMDGRSGSAGRDHRGAMGAAGFEAIDPEELGAPRGWSHGMLAPAGGRLLFVAGQDGTDAAGAPVPDGFVEQFGLALGKAVAVVRAAGGTPDAIGRLTIFVTDVEEYRARRADLKATYRAHMGRHFPAMALVEVGALVDPRARVEIEATAVVPAGGATPATDRPAPSRPPSDP